MENSEALKCILKEEELKALLTLCKETEEVGDASEKDICVVREKIEKLRKLQKEMSMKSNPTVFIYLERMLFYFQVCSLS
jgi:hypothetical protein